MVTDTLQYRAAREDDLCAVAQLWLEMFEAVGKYRESDFVPNWRERFAAYAAARMKANELRYFVAEEDGAVIGCAGALIRDGYPMEISGVRNGYIFGVSVRPEARKRGIATELTKRTIAWLKEIGARRIVLHASPFGRPIYEKLGFEPTNEMELTGLL